MKSPAAALFMFTPRIFKLIPSSLSGYAKLRAIVDDGVSFVKPSIEDHRATYNEDFQRSAAEHFYLLILSQLLKKVFTSFQRFH